jgi:MYXO-CTERM domain-containing protein
LSNSIHDQFTARICVEYFTVFHPPVFATTSPTLLALGWGVIATWWMGAGLGLLLAVACRAGRSPKLTFGDVAKPIGVLLAVMAGCAIAFGILGYLFGQMPTGWAGRIGPHLHRRFVAVWWAHNASYATGFWGALALCGLAFRRRTRLERAMTQSEISY